MILVYSLCVIKVGCVCCGHVFNVGMCSVCLMWLSEGSSNFIFSD